MANYNAEGKCKQCRKFARQRSVRGLCTKCMLKNVKAAATQLHNKKGPLYDKWKENLRASLGP